MKTIEELYNIAEHALDSRAASEQELRECESKWKSLEAEYRARSNI